MYCAFYEINISCILSWDSVIILVKLIEISEKRNNMPIVVMNKLKFVTHLRGIIRLLPFQSKLFNVLLLCFSIFKPKIKVLKPEEDSAVSSELTIPLTEIC